MTPVPVHERSDEQVAREWLDFLFKHTKGGQHAKAAGFTYETLPPNLRERLLAEARAQKESSREYERILGELNLQLARERRVAHEVG